MAASPPAQAPVAAGCGLGRGDPVGKAVEGETNRRQVPPFGGFETTLASVITVACPTRGFRAAFGAERDGS